MVRCSRRVFYEGLQQKGLRQHRTRVDSVGLIETFFDIAHSWNRAKPFSPRCCRKGEVGPISGQTLDLLIFQPNERCLMVIHS